MTDRIIKIEKKTIGGSTKAYDSNLMRMKIEKK